MRPLIKENPVHCCDFPDMRTSIGIFGMHIMQVNRRWVYPVHEHPTFEFNYILSGSRISTVSGVVYHLKQGDFLLIPPHEKHTGRSLGPSGFKSLCIHFSIDDSRVIRNLSLNGRIYYPQHSETAMRTRSVVDRIVMASKSLDVNRVSSRLKIQAHLLEILSNIADCEESAAVLQRTDWGELARQIQTSIASKVQLPLSCQDGELQHGFVHGVCRELDISPSYCYRVFKSVYGQSPRQFATDLMLARAKALLLQLDLPIAQIAASLGYMHASHFSRQFKRWTGQSPYEYRMGCPN